MSKTALFFFFSCFRVKDSWLFTGLLLKEVQQVKALQLLSPEAHPNFLVFLSSSPASGCSWFWSCCHWLKPLGPSSPAPARKRYSVFNSPSLLSQEEKLTGLTPTTLLMGEGDAGFIIFSFVLFQKISNVSKSRGTSVMKLYALITSIQHDQFMANFKYTLKPLPLAPIGLLWRKSWTSYYICKHFHMYV